MRFVVVQRGARRGYAVPDILERAGMLERFYTDICGAVGLGAAASRLRRLPRVGPSLGRLHARRPSPAVTAKTRTFGVPVVRHALESVSANKDPIATMRQAANFNKRWGAAMVRAGFGAATHVFSMLGEGAPLLVEAKRRGLSVVSEVYILLSTEMIIAEERQAFPDWEPAAPDYAALRRTLGVPDVLLTHSDYFICPSAAVADDLVDNWGIDRAKTALVPYGMDPRWLQLEPRPTPGRVLFVGTADLRKGIHYLAQAAEMLAADGNVLEFRVAGHVSPSIASRPECRRLTFLGRVPRDRIHEEFQQADLFVLPSLAEGSAEVTYEALAAGLPVVTTTASGSVVRDGIEGTIVPERNAQALAKAILGIVTQRALRDQLAVAARQRASEYTWDRYGQRLISALQGAGNS